MVSRADALSRTTLALRDLLDPSVTDDQLLEALGNFRVTIVAGGDVVADHPGQTTLLALGSLLTRSGMAVTLDSPDAPSACTLLGRWTGTFRERFYRALSEAIPGPAMGADPTSRMVIAIGALPPETVRRIADGAQVLWVGSDGSTATCSSRQPSAWSPANVLVGLAASGLVASETHKAFLRELPPRNSIAREIVAPLSHLSFEMPLDISDDLDLGVFDCVSGGAITHNLLFALLSLPQARGAARVIEFDIAAASNLNRCPLMFVSDLDDGKAVTLAAWSRPAFDIKPVDLEFEPTSAIALSHRVVVGADRIVVREWVAARRPDWVGVGATEGIGLVLVSEHSRGEPCPACLHPAPAVQTASIVPTLSVVSFWAGYLLALRLIAAATSQKLEPQVWRCMPLRLERIYPERIGFRDGCPVEGQDWPVAAAREA